MLFLRTQIELIEKIFNKNEVSNLDNLPDPQIKLKEKNTDWLI